MNQPEQALTRSAQRHLRWVLRPLFGITALLSAATVMFAVAYWFNSESSFFAVALSISLTGWTVAALCSVVAVFFHPSPEMSYVERIERA